MAQKIDDDTCEGTDRQNRGERLATLAHDLRTPLVSIKLLGELLRSGKLPASDVPRAIESILTAANEQERLIDQLLGSSAGGGEAEVAGSSNQSAAPEPSASSD